MKSEGLANGGEKKEKEKERREEKRKKKGGRGIVGERGGPNLVEEDCFHSVLKLKRSEDRRPRFESRLSAGDNQTGGDLFSPSLSFFLLSFFSTLEKFEISKIYYRIN